MFPKEYGSHPVYIIYAYFDRNLLEESIWSCSYTQHTIQKNQYKCDPLVILRVTRFGSGHYYQGMASTDKLCSIPWDGTDKLWKWALPWVDGFGSGHYTMGWHLLTSSTLQAGHITMGWYCKWHGYQLLIRCLHLEVLIINQGGAFELAHLTIYSMHSTKTQNICSMPTIQHPSLYRV